MTSTDTTRTPVQPAHDPGGPSVRLPRNGLFLLWTVGGVALAVLCWILIVLLPAGAQSERSRWIEETIAEKAQAAKASVGARLFVAGGTNVLFNVDTESLAQSLDRPVINYGLDRALGLDYRLYRLRHELRPGDAVLLILPYEDFTMPRADPLVLRDTVLATSHDYLATIDLQEALRVLLAADRYLLIESYLSLLALRDPMPWPYRAMKLGRSGDLLGNDRAAIRPAHTLAVAQAKPFRIPDGFPPAFEAKQLASQRELAPELAQLLPWATRRGLIAFGRWAAARGIQVYASWPDTLVFSVYRTPRYQMFFAAARAVYAEAGVAVLGEEDVFGTRDQLGAPDDFIHAPDHFFDDKYHLHNEARAAATARRALLIRQAL